MKGCILVAKKFSSAAYKFLSLEPYIITEEISNYSSIEDLNKIIEKNYDFILNPFIREDHDIIKHLLDKNVHIIGSPPLIFQDYLKIKNTIQECGLKVPENLEILREIQLPLVMKKYDQFFKKNSAELILSMAQLEETSQAIEKSSLNGCYFERFIKGTVFYVTVYEAEAKCGLLALDPYLKENEEFKKVEFNERMIRKIKNIGICVFDALGVRGSSFIRITFSIDKEMEIIFLNIDQMPDFLFLKYENQEKIIGSMTSARSKQSLLKSHFDSVAPIYDEKYFSLSQLDQIFQFLVDNFDYSGTILDLACGSGKFGEYASSKYQVDLYGVDISPQMAQIAENKGYSKVYVGLLENIVVKIEEKYEHLISNGVLHYLDPISYKKTLEAMFRISNKSITISVEDFPQEYNEAIEASDHSVIYFHNHIKIVEGFELPLGWRVAYKEKQKLWFSPKIQIDIHGHIIRFEKNA